MVGIFVRFRFLLSACMVACLLGYATAPSLAKTLWVDDDAPADPAHGDTSVSDPSEDRTAEHPFDAIQEALDAPTAARMSCSRRGAVAVQRGHRRKAPTGPEGFGALR